MATTLSGDILLYDATTMGEHWRARVEGSVGFYNSITVANLDGDAYSEVSIGGSAGIWRLHRPGK